MYKFFLLLLAVFALFTMPVSSQDEDEYEEDEELNEKLSPSDSTGKKVTALEEIVITGTRTEKKIIDIPYSVFRVDKKELIFGRDMNAKDILQDVPGLFIQTKYGSDVRISIRGFGTRSNSGVRGIKILLDGFTESEPDGETSMDAIDYSSLGGVEVVKGNQSSLYPNAPGGVINFLSDFSFTQNFVRSSSQFGSYGLMQNGLRAGHVSSKTKFLLSYTYKNYKGFREHGSEYSHLINANYLIDLENKSSLSIFTNYTRNFIRIPGALNGIEFALDPEQAYFQAVGSDFKRETQKGRVGLKYQKSWGSNNENQIELLGFGSIRDLVFTTNVLYNIKYKYFLGSSFRFTNKSPLLKTGNEFTVGADYNYVTGPLSGYTNLGGSKSDELQIQNTETQSNYGIFAFDQIELLKDKFYFLLSGRFDKVSITNNDELFSARNSTRSFSRFTPKAAINYKLAPTVSAYTSFGFGFDTPSASELENFPYSSNSGTTTLNPDINAQTSKNFEIGIKGNLINKKRKFIKKILFELTLFNTQVNDEIIPFVITDRVYFRNAAKTNRLGFESGFKIEPIERMDVLLNYTYTHFKYDKYISRIYPGTGDPIDVEYSGKLVPAVPQHLVNFIVEAEPEIARRTELLCIFDCDYISRIYTDDLNSAQASPYFYANATLGIKHSWKSINIILSGGVKNIFNKKFAGFVNINANPEKPVDQRRYYELGEPRNFYTSLLFSVKF